MARPGIPWKVAMRRWIAVAALLLLAGASLGQGASPAVDEAREKAREAMEAFSRAVQQITQEAARRTQEAADALRGTVQDSVRRACDAALNACLKACDGSARCEQACRTGRSHCHSG
jgi:hypothetical protein